MLSFVVYRLHVRHSERGLHSSCPTFPCLWLTMVSPCSGLPLFIFPFFLPLPLRLHIVPHIFFLEFLSGSTAARWKPLVFFLFLMVPLATESLESSVSSSGSDLLIQILFLCDISIIMQGPLLKTLPLTSFKTGTPLHCATTACMQMLLAFINQ